MSDAEILERLDRRFAAAVAELDRAVETRRTPVLPMELAAEPPRAAGQGRHPAWRNPRLLAAAAVLVAALVAAVLVLDDGEGETPVATTDAHRHLVLPPGQAEEFDTIVALDGGPAAAEPTSSASGEGPDPVLPDTDLDMEAGVHAPEGAEAPWPELVVDMSLDGTSENFTGEPVDLGGTDGPLDDEGSEAIVGWLAGPGRVRYLMSTTMPAEELVDLARAVVADDIPFGQALPGHQLLHAGPLGDIAPNVSLLANDTSPDVSMIAYADDVNGSDMEVLLVSTSPGTERRWRAAHALATSTETAHVRGHDAVVATFQGGITEVSWLEGGDTLVRVVHVRSEPSRTESSGDASPPSDSPQGASSGDGAIGSESTADRTAGWMSHIEALVEVSPSEWADLVAAHPPILSSTDSAEAVEVPPEGSPPATVGGSETSRQWSEAARFDEQRIGGTSIHYPGEIGPIDARALVRRTDQGGHTLEGEIVSGSASSGAAQSLDDLRGPVGATMSDGTHLIVYGVVPPHIERVELRGPDGSVVPTLEAGMPRGEPSVFLLVVEGIISLDDAGATSLVGIAADGSEISIPVG